MYDRNDDRERWVERREDSTMRGWRRQEDERRGMYDRDDAVRRDMRDERYDDRDRRDDRYDERREQYEQDVPRYERHRYDRDREVYGGYGGSREQSPERSRGEYDTYGYNHDRFNDWDQERRRNNGGGEYLGRIDDGRRAENGGREGWDTEYRSRRESRDEDFDRRRHRDSDSFDEYRGRDYGFSWTDGSNDATWRDFDRWGNEYSNHWRNEGLGWNRGSTRNQQFWSSPDRER